MSQTPLARPGPNDIGAALELSRAHLDLLVLHLAPPDPPPDPRGGRPPIPGWLRLCVVLLHLRLNRVSLRKVAAQAGISKSSVSRIIRDLTPRIATFGLLQADGTLLQPGDLQAWLAEIADNHEVTLLDGTFTQVPRPALASTRRLFYQVKSRTYCYQTLGLSTGRGDILVLDGGWPGKIHELDILDHTAFLPALEASQVTSLTDRGFRGVDKRTDANWALPVGSWAKRKDLPQETQAYNYVQNSVRAPAEHVNAALKQWGLMRFTRLRSSGSGRSSRRSSPSSCCYGTEIGSGPDEVLGSRVPCASLPCSVTLPT